MNQTTESAVVDDRSKLGLAICALIAAILYPLIIFILFLLFYFPEGAAWSGIFRGVRDFIYLLLSGRIVASTRKLVREMAINDGKGSPADK